jgi:hypothetical protein
MKFTINAQLLAEVQATLSKREDVYWLVGGAGAGKTTICQELAKQVNLVIYDMDAHIYGTYHQRFTAERHPVNTAWAKSENGLAWLLDMTWDEFNNFNQAALPEYLDLLVEDLENTNSDTKLLIDGGISNPALVSQVLPYHQIVCLAIPQQKWANVWEENEDRQAMKEFIYQLPEPEQAWQKFLEFDRKITQTILKEAEESEIAVCMRNETESIAEYTARVRQVLGL